MSKNIKQKKGLNKGVKINDVISLIMIIYTFVTIFLIGNTVLASFKSKQELVKSNIGIPKEFTLENFDIILLEEGFLRYIINSVVLVGCGLLLLIVISSLVAYGLAQYEFRGRNFLQTYFLVGLMFPIQLGILPTFILMTRLNLNNNLFGLILIYGANMSFSVYVFTRFFKELPKSLIESARIDGAGELRTYISIMVPISKPVFSTLGLINFILLWNDFYMPLVFLTKKSVRTVTLAVYHYMANFLANWNKVFAAVSVALIPLLVIYFLFSEQIAAGLTGGAVKE